MKILIILSAIFMISAPSAGTLKGTVGWERGQWFCSADNTKEKAVMLKGVYFRGDDKNGQGQKWVGIRQTVSPGNTVSLDKLYLAQINYVRECSFKY